MQLAVAPNLLNRHVAVAHHHARIASDSPSRALTHDHRAVDHQSGEGDAVLASGDSANDKRVVGACFDDAVRRDEIHDHQPPKRWGAVAPFPLSHHRIARRGPRLPYVRVFPRCAEAWVNSGATRSILCRFD